MDPASLAVLKYLPAGQTYGNGACKNTVPCVDYLNPGSFVLPAPGGFGNVGKGSLRGPNLMIPVRESWKLQLRGEFFNVLNRVNLNDPTNNISSGGFGSIRGAGNPRIGQLALKLIF